MSHRQGSTVDSLPETLEFDLGSTSNSSVMVDSHVCWNDMLNGQDLADYLLSPNESRTLENTVNTSNGILGGWNFDIPVQDELTIINESDLNGVKVEHDWMSMGAGPSNNAGSNVCDRELDSNLILSLDNAAINTTNNQANNELNFFQNFLDERMQNSGSENATQYSISDVGSSGTSSSDIGAAPSDFIRNSLPSDNHKCGAGSSCSNMASTGAIQHALEDGDSRRLSCKRKNIGGVPGQSSSSSSGFDRNERGTEQAQAVNSHHCLTDILGTSSSSDNVSVANHTGSLMASAGMASSSVASKNSSDPLGESAEYTPRNFRLRINPSSENMSPDPASLQPIGSSIGAHNPWHQPLSSLLPPPVRGGPPVASMTSQVQMHFPVGPVLPSYASAVLNAPNPGPEPPLASSTPVRPSDTIGTFREEINMVTLLRNRSTGPSTVTPSSLHAPQIYLGLSSAGINTQANASSSLQHASSPGRFPSASPVMVPPRNPSDQSQLSLDFIRQSILTARSNSAGQNNDLQQLSSLHTVTPAREMRLRAQEHFRSLVDRQNDTSNGNSSSRTIAVRERRTRMLSEIRNMIGALRRGENLRFEDLIVEHSVIMGAVDLHDRHRDMRLDVDNMSYEELLDLEERIGNVSTGLSEEAVLKCLKHMKYSSLTIKESSKVEPCCVCQEDYVEGEDMGRLVCGHDFHSACIKQWLAHKNMCPICKTAALAT